MNEEWLWLVKRYTEAGARTKFEDICESLFKKKYPNNHVKGIKVVVGDGGVDIFIGELGIEPITIIQCKFFVNGIGESQKKQIRDSFKTVINSNEYDCSKWMLCVPTKLGIDEQKWWAGWKNRNEEIHGDGYIELHDGADLIDSLKEYNLYDTVFDEDIRKKIAEIYNLLIHPKVDVESEFLSASTHLANLKNYFSDKKATHLVRKETNKIVEWVRSDLPGESPEEKILIVKGKKGIGKSTILKDLYSILKDSESTLVLGIKCDQYYDKNIRDLYKLLFQAISTLPELVKGIETSGKRCIILLDQLDALSQTLSSDRAYLSTYIRFVDELLSLKDVRIIISSRSYDLQFDADLKRYNDSSHIKKIEVDHLSKEEVHSVLKTLKIQNVSKRLTSLLIVPYNFELFTKIPDVNQLIQKDGTITISKIYDELWRQVLSDKNFQIKDCLDLIVQQMYEITPNLISEAQLTEYVKEVEYLLSHNILVRNSSKLSFFHQSFYEYHLARWFVSSDRNLIKYILEEDQSLYIRSLVKTVIEYLREAKHQKYINLYQEILADDRIRFHIKYLFIAQLGGVQIPSKKEQILLVDDVLPSFSSLFMEVVDSKGWLDLLLENDLVAGEEVEIYNLLTKNINHNPNAVLEFIERSAFPSKAQMMRGLIPSIENWDSELLRYFENYYLYSQDTELWYFTTLKKIARSNIEFVFKKLRPVVLQERDKKERITFDHRYDKLIDVLYNIDSKGTCEFLLSVQLEMLESTKYNYFQTYPKITTPLLNSHVYDSRYRYVDAADEKSLDYYLIKFYTDCESVSFQTFFDTHKASNYVPILTTIAKILKDRIDRPTNEIVELLVTIESKNGFIGPDDFFQLTLRKLIANTVSSLNDEQYALVVGIINKISHPYEIYIGTENDKKKYSLRIGKKKYLFIKALPQQILKRDQNLWLEFKMLERRFGYLDHNKSLDRSSSRGGAVGPPLPNLNYNKLNNKGWLVSMKAIDENFQSKEFLRGGLVEHARVFENRVSKSPTLFYPLIEQLFSENVSQAYISYGISGLIKCKFDPEKVSNLIHRFIELDLKPEYRQYTIWNLDYLLENKIFSEHIFDFLISSIKTQSTESDVLNPDHPMSDFINTVRGAACYNLFFLTSYPEYEGEIFSMIEHLVDPINNSSNTILCGIMSHLGYLNRWNIERSFGIFKTLISYQRKIILEHSIDTAQYFNNSYHSQMQFYFDEILKYPELYEKSYFFVNSWLLESINDYSIYDNFLLLGEEAAKCALTVAEAFLINEDGINKRALDVVNRCLAFEYEQISGQISSIVLRKFEVKYFQDLSAFIKKYIASEHFTRDPRYLLLYLTECAGQYPLECLNMLDQMIIPENVDISKRAYLDDEPLTLILAIYSKLHQGQLKYRCERRRALDIFDRMLALPAIRRKATNALEDVLN
ncbi:NACHT domain-containing protein [Sphingobacterium arenae]|uniref:ATP-binding protein n=1 Tax=Sphingobacterium arenae TaxID=1280598 RepID=A0ABR7Y302_9SPHI|nr:NACHT domain-containing protein [Sphingobacterium arenae]MBD1425676.1 ATP-binding protein [Sphingobacterium arenae]